MNMQPGYFDIGSAPDSAMENFTDPDFHKLSPYVP